VRVLVTGGSGVIGESAVRALLERGHQVRLLSRQARGATQPWPRGVEAFPGDVAREDTLGRAAEGCAAVLHLASIGAEEPPGRTFWSVNVEGTRNVLREAERAGVPRFVFVSSLGADRGSSDYHASKRAAEEHVRGFAGEWVVVRPGNVYGPGDEVISLLLKLVRTLPALPLIGAGDQPFQPIWHEDLAGVLVECLERDDLAGRSLDVAGPETTSMAELVDLLSELTGRRPLTVPVPPGMVDLAARAAEMVGLPLGLDRNKLTMLREHNVMLPDGQNALAEVLGREGTRLGKGLRLLAQSMPEQLPQEGTGALEHKRFWAEIRATDVDSEELRNRFRARFAEVMPLAGSAADGGRTRPLRKGDTLTLQLPTRGQIQVRLAESQKHRLTFLTVEGHPLAGALTFHFQPGRFEVEVHARPANVVDRALMGTIGDLLQDGSWVQVVRKVVELSGGDSPQGVQRSSERLAEPEARAVEQRLSALVMRRRRETNAAGGAPRRGVQPSSHGR
jgi:uncharacterized protein YbjT (DUF2867 family)